MCAGSTGTEGSRATAEPNRALVLRGPGTQDKAFATGMGYPSWAFVIKPAAPRQVRLLVRWRCDFPPTFGGFLLWKYGIEPVHFVMERKMLKGIKHRAETLHRQRTRTAVPLRGRMAADRAPRAGS